MNEDTVTVEVTEATNVPLNARGDVAHYKAGCTYKDRPRAEADHIVKAGRGRIVKAARRDKAGARDTG